LDIRGETEVKKTLPEIEQNIVSRKETDRIMWFSWWAVISVASFGIAWFPMIYYTINRRNDHFSRQAKLEALILQKLKKTKNQKKVETSENILPRNAALLTLSTLLIVPAFYIFYALKRDLLEHEMHEHVFLTEIRDLAKDYKAPLNIQSYSTTPSFPLDKYVILSLVTCGLGAAYWLYRLFNDYNNHFKMQWMIEDELLGFLKVIDKKAS
jgi:hypothetical protein